MRPQIHAGPSFRNSVTSESGDRESPNTSPSSSNRNRRLSRVGTATSNSRGWAEIPTYDEATGGSPRPSDVTQRPDDENPEQETDQTGQLSRSRTFLQGMLSRLGRADTNTDIPLSTGANSNSIYRTSSEAEQGGRPSMMTSRSAGQSLTSLLLYPTTTNMSTQTTGTISGRSSRSGSGTLHRPSFLQGSSSTLDLAQPLPISAPVPGSVIKTGYVPPKKGFTPDQIKFLTSTDNLGKFGVPVTSQGDQGSGSGRRRRSTGQPSLRISTGADNGDLPPPTWDDVVEHDRRRSVSSVVIPTTDAPGPETGSTVPAPRAADNAVLAESGLTDVAITPVARESPREHGDTMNIEVVPPTPL